MLPNEPSVLVSYINTKLRDEYPSLEDLCEDNDIEVEVIIKKLAAAGYKFNEDTNQFR